MDYYKNPEEFYESIKKQREEVKSYDISEDEKNKLYSLFDDTVQRFEEDRSNSISENIPRLNKALDKIGDGFSKLIEPCQKIKNGIPALEKTVFDINIKKAFDSQDPSNN